MSSDGNDTDSNNSINESEKEQNKTSVVELLDELISLINTTRSAFRIMTLSSFILTPLCLILTVVFVIHPFFVHRILFGIPEVGIFLLFFIGVSVTMASMWLYIGLSGQGFFSNCDKKLIRYASLKNQFDK